MHAESTKLERWILHRSITEILHNYNSISTKHLSSSRLTSTIPQKHISSAITQLKSVQGIFDVVPQSTLTSVEGYDVAKEFYTNYHYTVNEELWILQGLVDKLAKTAREHQIPVAEQQSREWQHWNRANIARDCEEHVAYIGGTKNLIDHLPNAVLPRILRARMLRADADKFRSAYQSAVEAARMPDLDTIRFETYDVQSVPESTSGETSDAMVVEMSEVNFIVDKELDRIARLMRLVEMRNEEFESPQISEALHELEEGYRMVRGDGER
jgi:hypothetical protein